ncbi:MAG: endonuclease III domain-containing protein [Pseudonocardiales bacterium]
MRPALVLSFDVQPDLAGTMDIQIPSLAWEPLPEGRFRRVYHLAGKAITVEVVEGVGALHFFFTAPTSVVGSELEALLRRSFPRMIGSLVLDANPTLRSLRNRYQGVIIMHCDPFEALVLTMLSQNRTGEIVRRVYPALEARCRGVTPPSLAMLGADDLREVIRSAGPYKAPRLAQTAARVVAEGEHTFHRRVVDAPGGQALAYLESFPGVAHKTAACVLVFSALSTITLPVDTHLFRVVDRLGLAHHNGTNNKTSREALITSLLGYGPDLAPAHFLFLLVGRDTCLKAAPSCLSCFLRPQCQFATSNRTRLAFPAGVPVAAARIRRRT